MADPEDMIMPMLRTIREDIRQVREETSAEFAKVDQRLRKIESAQHSFKHALNADTLMSKLVTGEFESRIEALEEEVAKLKAGH